MAKFVVEAIQQRYVCPKCQNKESYIKEVSMSGTGLGKIFDVEYNHYLFVSCVQCGYVEVYNPSVLAGKKGTELSSVLDIVFG